MEEQKKFDLEERLIEYACLIIEIVEKIENTKAGNHIGGQLLRSGTAPTLNYAEAKSAESKKDFIHKMKICLKELRESFVCLKIIAKRKMIKDEVLLKKGLKETDELISIFVKSIQTASNKVTS